VHRFGGNILDRERSFFTALQERLDLFLVFEAAVQLCLQRFPIRQEERCRYAECRLSRELIDFPFPLHDKPHGDRLNAAGRQCRLDFLPQDRRELETNDTVEDTTRLLRIYQVHVDMPGILYCVQDRIFGDFVENDAFSLIGFQAQYFRQVPGNSLSFAVLIRRKPDG